MTDWASFFGRQLAKQFPAGSDEEILRACLGLALTELRKVDPDNKLIQAIMRRGTLIGPNGERVPFEQEKAPQEEGLSS